MKGTNVFTKYIINFIIEKEKKNVRIIKKKFFKGFAIILNLRIKACQKKAIKILFQKLK